MNNRLFNRKNPLVPALSVDGLAPHRVNDQERWRRIIAADMELVMQIRTIQETWRLGGHKPDWSFFTGTEYFWQIRKTLNDERRMLKFKAWYDLLFDINNGSETDRQFTEYAMALINAGERKKSEGVGYYVPFKRFGLTKEQADKILIAVASRFEHLIMR